MKGVSGMKVIVTCMKKELEVRKAREIQGGKPLRVDVITPEKIE